MPGRLVVCPTPIGNLEDVTLRVLGALRVIERAGRRLGVGIANLVNIFNPEVVVVGGGAVAAGELLLTPARKVLGERALRPSRDVVRVVPAQFGTEAGMLGAAVLALADGEV